MDIKRMNLSGGFERGDIASAIDAVKVALSRLAELCDVQYVAVDDGDALLELANIVQDKDSDGRDIVYVELTYPRRK